MPIGNTRVGGGVHGRLQLDGQLPLRAGPQVDGSIGRVSTQQAAHIRVVFWHSGSQSTQPVGYDQDVTANPGITP